MSYLPSVYLSLRKISPTLRKVLNSELDLSLVLKDEPYCEIPLKGKQLKHVICHYGAYTLNSWPMKGVVLNLVLLPDPAEDDYSRYEEHLQAFVLGKCCDCSRKHRFYMVYTEVWIEAWPNVEEVRLWAALRLEQNPGHLHCCLCLECLVKRLKRPLDPKDFMERDLNDWVRKAFEEGGLANVLDKAFSL